MDQNHALAPGKEPGWAYVGPSRNSELPLGVLFAPNRPNGKTSQAGGKSRESSRTGGLVENRFSRGERSEAIQLVPGVDEIPAPPRRIDQSVGVASIHFPAQVGHVDGNQIRLVLARTPRPIRQLRGTEDASDTCEQLTKNYILGVGQRNVAIAPLDELEFSHVLEIV